MKPHEIKLIYGENYPAQLVSEGVVYPLKAEQRFSRIFTSDDEKMTCVISRFMDKSASITAVELEQEWPNWSDEIRQDFASNCNWLAEQPDAPQMARFLMKHGDENIWSPAAQFVTQTLGQEEAFQVLCQKLALLDPVKGINIAQAIALTKHPQARAVLREQLAKLLLIPTVWDNDKFINWPAYALTCCIEHMIELGATPTDFEATVQKLAQHTCARNRDSCQSRLAKYYDWMEKQ